MKLASVRYPGSWFLPQCILLHGTFTNSVASLATVAVVLGYILNNAKPSREVL